MNSQILRTPDERFENLPGYNFAPNYLEVDGMRVHYVDEGPKDGEIVLMMHGEPTWCYLYRKMIPIFVNAGYRAIAPDLIGFGRSDKPAAASDHSYNKQVGWMADWMQQLDLNNITLVCQDWGSLIGLRLVGEHPDRFARVLVTNGGMPTGDQEMPRAFKIWQRFSKLTPILPIGRLMQFATRTELPADVVAAYKAPFPRRSYSVAARIYPSFVPTRPNDPASVPNRAAWEVLKTFNKPFVTAFASGDPITKGGDRVFHKLVPGTKNQEHTTIRGASHFIQEDKGEELAEFTIQFMQKNPLA